MNGPSSMGLARTAVGLALLAAPATALRLSRRAAPTGASILLMRTIGIRDVVIGIGTVSAGRGGTHDDTRRWLRAGLTSDTMDVAAGLLARRSIGPAETVVAVGAAAVFVGLDLLATRSLSASASEVDRPAPR
jgi:hypothetical protein